MDSGVDRRKNGQSKEIVEEEKIEKMKRIRNGSRKENLE